MDMDRKEQVNTRGRTNSTESFRWPLGCVDHSSQSQSSAPWTSDNSQTRGHLPGGPGWGDARMCVEVESKVKLVPYPGRTSASWVTQQHSLCSK